MWGSLETWLVYFLPYNKNASIVPQCKVQLFLNSAMGDTTLGRKWMEVQKLMIQETNFNLEETATEE